MKSKLHQNPAIVTFWKASIKSKVTQYSNPSDSATLTQCEFEQCEFFFDTKKFTQCEILEQCEAFFDTIQILEIKNSEFQERLVNKITHFVIESSFSLNLQTFFVYKRFLKSRTPPQVNIQCREVAMVKILRGQNILLGGAKPTFCPICTLKGPIIGGAAAPSATPYNDPTGYMTLKC